MAGPSAADIDSALNSLQSAQEQLQELREDPDALEVEQARSNLQSAETRLSDLLADPGTVELLRARSNLLSAVLTLESATDDYDDLLAGADTAFLFYGDGAAWRSMSIDTAPGPDIGWLETNLVALGYGDLEVDDVFDSETADAVMAWQTDVGVTATGKIPLGQVVFIAGPAPVSALAVSRGDSVNEGAVLYELTAVELVSSTVGPDGVQDQTVTAQRVTARLDLVDQDLLALGTSVLIELPDDSEVDGEVIELGAVPVIVSATEQSNESSYLDVVIAPGESVDSNWTGATVQVRFATEVAQAVLSVPVSQGVAPRERRERAAAALDRVGLGNRKSHVPSKMSGGERQRVAIARALVHDPALILADEPTGNLDSKANASIIELFERLHAEGSTIVVVTHNDEIAAHLPRIVRLLDGQVQSDTRQTW